MSLATGEDLPKTVSDGFGAYEGLDLMLQNPDIFRSFHESSESGSRFFSRLHPRIQKILLELDTQHQAEMFSRGFATYEIVAMFDPAVQHELQDDLGINAIKHMCLQADSFDLQQLLDAAHEARDDSELNTPELMAFGREVLSRYAAYDLLALGYGLDGIASGRQWHMSVVREESELLAKDIAYDDRDATS